VLLTVVLFALGFALIIKGGDYFVGSSVGIAEHLKIPRMVIGSTIVSIATTSPEFIVSTTASLRGEPGIAIGNAVGSAILNIGLILALVCMIRPIPVNVREFRVPSLALLGVAILLTALTLGLTLSRLGGATLLLLGLSYLFFDYLRHKRGGTPKTATENAGVLGDHRMRTLKRALLYFALGLALVIAGSKLMVDSAVKIAEALEVRPIIIGLTIIALGTSLPELVTAITSVRKKVSDLSLGNIVGAGLLNCTVVTGTSAVITPLAMSRTTQMYNLPALIVTVGMLILLARAGKRLSRRDGAILFGLYAAYIAGVILLRGR
jgi:cation:H+ antiporter